ncbi:UDP-N-acetylglucosamine--LPS N-acetylglucosamine transferase [Nostocales cyanobacterium HT-58-2]|nr:UDP-N-acetylglucosamine--LPS N-acetylglucosamine transferase [Nostocales cyanobacterium HT-58-2]
MMKKVYLMIYDAGAGHRSTANALQKVIEQQKLPWEVYLVEAFKEILGTSTSQNFYNNYVLQKNWAKIINEPLLVPLFKLQIRFSHSAWLASLKTYWKQHKPDMVVSVQPYLNRVFYESLQIVLPDIPFVTLITDHADCPPHFWIEKQEQFLICPTKKAVEQAKSFGYTQERLFRTSGVIIHPRFYEPILCDRRIERQHLGLDPDCMTGLVLFGGNGSRVMLEIAKCLESFQQKLQLIFICGRNEELAKALRESQVHQKRFVTTFTQNVPYYMHLADFFIGKPGPGSLSEALVMKLPVIVERNFSTLIQERYNADWVEQQQVGLVISNFRNIDKAVKKFLEPENFARYRANVAAVNNRAVFEISDILQNILAKSYNTAVTKAMA